jgi:tetratricopeptide (TPR) repeat protein
MIHLLAGIFGAALFTNSPQVDTNLTDLAGTTIWSAGTNDVTEQELDKVMEDDDAALDEINKWIQENNAFAAQGAGETKAQLNARIVARLGTVRTNYLDFFQRYPTNALAYLAYGSFLNDIGDEEGAHDQYEKSRQLDPKNPAVWNNLANYYGENSPVTNAFAYYQQAIALNPLEPVYYENFATTVYLFRRDAMRFYSITEPQVFDKALALYRKAIELDPDNFPLRTDYAESYYGIRPLRTNDALVSWTNALSVAHSDLEREGVYIHLARIKIAVGRYAEAQAHLDAVTNPADAQMRDRLERNLRERQAAGTNSVYFENWTNAPPTNNVVAPTNNPILLTNPPPVMTNGLAMPNPPPLSPIRLAP